MQDSVIDISHHNGLSLDFTKAKADGIQAIVHKASQGIRYTDPRLIINRQAIIDAGLLFGLYHFGTGSATGVDQADYFLNLVQDVPNTLIALDFEPNPQGPVMTLRQAQDFCAAVEDAAKRAIVIYTGSPMFPSANELQHGLYGERPLWFAQYANSPSRAPKTWALSMWQYSESAFVEGIGHCDRNEFYGDDLEGFWKGSAFVGVTGGAEGGVTQ